MTATANDQPTTDDIEAESPDQAWAEACKKHRLVRLYNGKVEELPTRAELLARITTLETAGRKLVNSLPDQEIDLAREVWGNTNANVVLNYKNEFAALLGETK